MPLDPLSLGLGVLQSGIGLVDMISGKSKVNNLTNQLTTFKTPDEINKLLALALNQSGGDTQTRDFQTNQLDRAFSGMLGTSEKLGADPNDLSALFDQRINGLLKIGAQFHASNTENIGRLFNAYNIKAANSAAEQKSQNDLLKDKIAAASGQALSGYGNVSGGLNTILSTVQADKANNLYPTT